ncbi:hypothetical protein KQ3_04918 [Bacillus cereus B5-2]|nr:hypothetical protein KQ3_04918 [Bacillus cereus B5-2]
MAPARLNKLCSTLEAATGVLIRLKGLNVYPAAVQLLHDILTELLRKKITVQFTISSVHTNHFCRIRVLDSTVFQLLDAFADKYGDVHTAGVKIQFIATSHNPLSLRGLIDGEVAVLLENEDENPYVIQNLPSQEGFNVEALLTSKFLDYMIKQEQQLGNKNFMK